MFLIKSVSRGALKSELVKGEFSNVIEKEEGWESIWKMNVLGMVKLFIRNANHNLKLIRKSHQEENN